MKREAASGLVYTFCKQEWIRTRRASTKRFRRVATSTKRLHRVAEGVRGEKRLSRNSQGAWKHLV